MAMNAVAELITPKALEARRPCRPTFENSQRDAKLRRRRGMPADHPRPAPRPGKKRARRRPEGPRPGRARRRRRSPRKLRQRRSPRADHSRRRRGGKKTRAAPSRGRRRGSPGGDAGVAAGHAGTATDRPPDRRGRDPAANRPHQPETKQTPTQALLTSTLADEAGIDKVDAAYQPILAYVSSLASNQCVAETFHMFEWEKTVQAYLEPIVADVKKAGAVTKKFMDESEKRVPKRDVVLDIPEGEGEILCNVEFKLAYGRRADMSPVDRGTGVHRGTAAGCHVDSPRRRRGRDRQPRVRTPAGGPRARAAAKGGVETGCGGRAVAVGPTRI